MVCGPRICSDIDFEHEIRECGSISRIAIPRNTFVNIGLLRSLPQEADSRQTYLEVSPPFHSVVCPGRTWFLGSDQHQKEFDISMVMVEMLKLHLDIIGVVNEILVAIPLEVAASDIRGVQSNPLSAVCGHMVLLEPVYDSSDLAIVICRSWVKIEFDKGPFSPLTCSLDKLAVPQVPRRSPGDSL